MEGGVQRYESHSVATNLGTFISATNTHHQRNDVISHDERRMSTKKDEKEKTVE